MSFDLQSDELSDFSEFEFPEFDSITLKAQFCHVGVCCRMVITGVVAAIFSAWVWSPPAGLQPTVVGMLWASLYLVGTAAGSVRRGNAWFACLAGCYVWFSQLAMLSLTKLVAAECVLMVVCTFSAGWLVTQFEFTGRSPQTSATQVRRYQQWTIWDLALLTTLVAVICYALPKLETPLILLTQVGFVVLGGCVCSWVAYRWVFDDCWTTTKLIMFFGGGLSILMIAIWIVSLRLLSPASPFDLSLQQIAAWMLTGPLAVIAAQGLTVLALLTAIRLDQGSLTTIKQPAEQATASQQDAGDSPVGPVQLRAVGTDFC